MHEPKRHLCQYNCPLSKTVISALSHEQLVGSVAKMGPLPTKSPNSFILTCKISKKLRRHSASVMGNPGSVAESSILICCNI